MDFEIVDKPKGFVGRWHRWQGMFDALPFDKAVKFDLPSSERAKTQGINIQTSIRKSARLSYRVHTRIVPNGAGATLYVWKEEKD